MDAAIIGQSAQTVRHSSTWRHERLPPTDDLFRQTLVVQCRPVNIRIVRSLGRANMFDTVDRRDESGRRGRALSNDTERSNPDTTAIASFVAGLTYERIPSEVIERIKLLILDALGCAVFGAGLEWRRILMETLAAVDSTAGCRVWGTGRRL